MKKQLIINSVLIASVTLGAANASALEPHEPVLASFERQFNHQPTPAAPATNAAIEDDALYRIVNTALWTPAEEDPVLASFEREFNHQPAATPAAKSITIEEDVLYQHINEPLRGETRESGDPSIQTIGAR